MPSRVAIHDQGNVGLRLSSLSRVSIVRTSRADVALYRHPELGRVLVVNDEIQHVEAWAPLYHEPLIHLPAAFIPRVRRALILGGGSFFAAAEVLKYRSLRQLVMVDHDAELLSLIAGVYSHAQRALSDRRVTIHAEDVREASRLVDGEFDLVINDAVDLTQPRYRCAFSMMSLLAGDEGICSDVVYRHLFAVRRLRIALQSLAAANRSVLSLVTVPEYPGVLHVLALWGRSTRLDQRASRSVNVEQEAWTSRRGRSPCVYFDPRFLPYYLYLPRYMRDEMPSQRKARRKLKSSDGQVSSSQ